MELDDESTLEAHTQSERSKISLTWQYDENVVFFLAAAKGITDSER